MNLMVVDFQKVDEFELIFKENYSGLCNTALQFLKDKASSEDLVQDTFIKLWEGRSTILIGKNPHAYLHKMVVNACLNQLEKKNILRFERFNLEENRVGSNLKGLESKSDLQQLRTLINTSINNLPPKCRAVFMLCRYENMKYKEVASILDISIKTVETQMGIAIERVEKELKPLLLKHFPDLLALVVFAIFLCS